MTFRKIQGWIARKGNINGSEISSMTLTSAIEIPYSKIKYKNKSSDSICSSPDYDLQFV
jgi:hypothetical protein